MACTGVEVLKIIKMFNRKRCVTSTCFKTEENILQQLKKCITDDFAKFSFQQAIGPPLSVFA